MMLCPLGFQLSYIYQIRIREYGNATLQRELQPWLSLCNCNSILCGLANKLTTHKQSTKIKVYLPGLIMVLLFDHDHIDLVHFSFLFASTKIDIDFLPE